MGEMAERVGFEPTVRFPVRSLSRRVLSTAQSPLRGRCRLNRSRALRFSAIGEGTLWQCVGKYRAESMQCCWTAGASRKSRMRRLKRVLLAARCEERLDDGCTFGGEDARSDFHLMIKARVGEDFEARADGAAFGIVGAVDETRDTGLEDCA
jgi:hypothetical protein